MSKNQKPIVQGKCVKFSEMKSQFISAAEAKKGGFIFTVPADSRSCWSGIWTRVRGISNCYSRKQEKE